MHYFSPLTPTVFLERSGKVFPSALAIRDRGRDVSYGELLWRSRRLARALVTLGVGRGDRVALVANNSRQVLEANFGIPGAGGVIVSLNPWLPSDDIAQQLKYADCRVVVVSHDCLLRHGRAVMSGPDERAVVVFDAPRASELPASAIDYECALASVDGVAPLNEAVEDELAPIVVNFTSGTTGTPKGVMMSHRGAYLHALGQVLMLGLGSTSRYLWTLPMFHVNGWGHMWANAAVGAAQLLLELPGPWKEDELRFSARLREPKVTHLAGAPRLLRRLLALEGAAESLAGCTVVTGGSAPPVALAKELEAAGARLIHQYGLNETFGPYVVCEEQATWLEQDAEARAALRSRQGVAAIHVGTGLKVVGGDGREVPADGKTLGEVLMAGNTVALGYFGAPEATARAFADGWFHSGDLAVVHPDGYLELKDRIKDLIYVETDYGWENISSLEVEQVLVQCPGVGDAALLGVRSLASQAGAELVAVIEPDARCPASAATVSEFCEQRLPVHMRPRRFVLASIPKTATGKTRKDVLIAGLEAEHPTALANVRNGRGALETGTGTGSGAWPR
jgi:fatty-acyl-CoA synthase